MCTCLRSMFTFDVRTACCKQASEPFVPNSASFAASQRILPPTPACHQAPGNWTPFSCVFNPYSLTWMEGGRFPRSMGGRTGSSGSGSSGRLSRLGQRTPRSIRSIRFRLHRQDTIAAKTKPKDLPRALGTVDSTSPWDSNPFLESEEDSTPRPRRRAPDGTKKRGRGR